MQDSHQVLTVQRYGLVESLAWLQTPVIFREVLHKVKFTLLLWSVASRGALGSRHLHLFPHQLCVQEFLKLGTKGHDIHSNQC